MATIRTLRELHPFFGKAKIHALCLKQGLSISLSSVGRTLHFLTQRGIITPVVVLKCNKQRKFIRKFTNSYSKRLPKHYKAPIQLDHTIINLRGAEHRVFVAYDRASKFSLCKSYKQATADNATNFLHYISTLWPYTLHELQVDGGSEFRGNFELACQNKHIRLFVLPPRSPKLNGGVQRYNQTIQDEFFLPNYNTLPTQVDALNLKLQQWSFYYNNLRPHRSLPDKRGIPIPPVQFLQQHSLICTEP
ncbi:MAG: DDE-type integrase/transposase/recombinase [Elusimicrobiaceae bacterium]|nr:DDE-type integrase/transposase/recombinase [Elusimicrobiaceae bacterium]